MKLIPDEVTAMDEEKYIRGLSDYELSRMVNLDSDRYTKQELNIALDEMSRRESAKAPADPALSEEPAPPAPTATVMAAEPPADGEYQRALSPVDERRIRRLTYDQLSDMVYLHADKHTKAERDIAFNELCLRAEGMETGEQAEPQRDDGIGMDSDNTSGFGTGYDDRDEDGLHTLYEDDTGVEHATIRCSYCGRELPRDARYCLECGRKVTGGSSAMVGGRALGFVVGILALIFFLGTRACR